jgi:hypothetical protein
MAAVRVGGGRPWLGLGCGQGVKLRARWVGGDGHLAGRLPGSCPPASRRCAAQDLRDEAAALEMLKASGIDLLQLIPSFDREEADALQTVLDKQDASFLAGAGSS